MKILLKLLLFFSFLVSLPVLASEDCTSVIFNSKSIVCFTAGHSTLSVNERALILERRLTHLANNYEYDPKQIVIEEERGVLNVSLNEYFILSLRKDDFLYDKNTNYKVAAKEVVSNIQAAIKETRNQKLPETIVHGAIYTVIASLILFLVLLIFSKTFPLIYSWIEIKGKRIPSIKIQSWELLNSERLVEFILWIAQATRLVLTLIALYIYIPGVLSFFPQTAPMAPEFFNFIADPIKHIFSLIIGFIPNLFFLIIISVIAFYALKLIQFFFTEIEKGKITFEGFHPEWARPTFLLVRILVIAFSLVMAFPYIPGSSSPAFQGVSVFLGILLSFGSTSAIANIISGIVLTYMRPFKVGDMVRIADTIGEVIEKNFLVTRVRSIKNIEITIPNSMVLGSHIINYCNNADTDGLILNVEVTFGYDVPWTNVHSILKEAAAKTPLVASDPPPFVWHKSLNQSFATYELNCFTHSPLDMWQIYSDLNQNIQDCFTAHGIELVVVNYTAFRDGNEAAIPVDYRKKKD
jgi:small-conductance mechanosensitive channel